MKIKVRWLIPGLLVLLVILGSFSPKTTSASDSVGFSEKGILKEEWRYPLHWYSWGWFGSSPAILDLGPDVNQKGGEPDSDLEIITGSDEYCNYYPELEKEACGIWRVFDSKGNVEWAKDTETDEARSSPAVVDVDGDGKPEIIGGTTSGWFVEVMDYLGQRFIWTFPKLPGYYTGGPFVWPSSPAVADIDKNIDGLEIVIGNRVDGKVYAFDGANNNGKDDGITITSLPWFPYPLGTEGIDWDVLWVFEPQEGIGENGIVSTPAIADVDKDEELEVVVGSTNGYLYILNASNGSLEYKFKTEGPIYSSPALTNIDVDKYLEIIVGSNDGNVYCFQWNGKTGKEKWKFSTQGAVYSSPAIGDIDEDGKFEVVAGSNDGRVYALSASGTKEWEFSTEGAVYSSPAIANRGKDFGFDIYVGSDDGYLYLLDGKTGTEFDRFEVYRSWFGGIHTSPSVADIDGDNKLEIIFYDWGQGSAYGGHTFWVVEDTQSNVDKHSIQWGMFRGNPSRTGTFRIWPDFWIDKIDPVQVVWRPDINDDGKIDLVAGKSIMVRVEIGMKDYEALDKQQLVEVRLTFEGTNYTATRTIEQLEHNKRIEFYPTSPLTIGDQTITAIVDPENKIKEVDETNDSTSTEITVKDTKSLYLVYFPVNRPLTYFGYGPIDIGEYASTVDQSGRFIGATYPVAEKEFTNQKRKEKYYGNPVPGLLGMLNDALGIWTWGELLTGTLADRSVGIVPDDYFRYHLKEEVTGISFARMGIRGVLVGNGYWKTTAHEIGHTYKLRLTEEEYVTNPPGNPASGFWVNESREISNGICFMGAAGPKHSFDYWDGRPFWIDNEDYAQLFKQFRVNKTDPEVLLISGIITKDGTVQLGKSYLVENGTIDDITPGDYSIQILNAEGQVLIDIPFYTSFHANIDPIGIVETDFAGFAFAIPYPENSATARVLYKDKIMTEVNLPQKLFEDAINTLGPHYDTLIETVKDAEIERGIKNSLVSKLDNAKMKLEQGLRYIENKQNIQGKNMLNSAANIVKAFIDEVNALRGKKISKEDADAFVSWAQKMILGIQNQAIKILEKL